jgi:SHS2 domain-containing protein
MHRWIDHIAEVELQVEADSPGRVVGEALDAVRELLGEPSEEEPVVLERIEVDARDRPALLAGWLEELVFLAESRQLLCVGIVDLEVEANAIRATVEARPGAPRHLIKAVTYHRLRFERSGDRWVAGAVLDV